MDIAIEVIMRSADAEHGRRYGYNAHGGYVEGGRFRNECREKVFAAISDVHGLTLQQVRHASATRTRDWRMALIAAVPFAALYYLAAVRLCRMWLLDFHRTSRRNDSLRSQSHPLPQALQASSLECCGSTLRR